MITIRDCRFSIDYKNQDIENVINKKLRNASWKSYKIYKRSLDSRNKNDIHYVITLLVELSDKGKEAQIVKKVNNKNIMLTKTDKYHFPYQFEGEIEESDRPVIAGAGPAGYFAAIYLAEAGFRPIVLERGYDVDRRTKDVDDFWNGGKLDTESNVSFGEGGAGTFSDGKLYTGNKNKGGYFTEVLGTFHRFGASEEITYDAKPHIGTDALKNVMKNMREFIISHGGEILFGHRLDDIEFKDDLYELQIHVNDKSTVNNDDGHCEKKIITKNLILALGHSARDTMKMLYYKGLQMEQKPYAIGLRIEHRRDAIDKAMYGETYAGKLPAADYKLTYHATNGRPVFSFCMCPGGYVVNASSEEGCLVVNGMSYSGRNGDNSNTALVTGITPDDFEGDSPLDAIKFQKSLEQAFYKECNGRIPVQRLEDFKNKTSSKELGEVIPQIKGAYELSELTHLLPDYVVDAITESFDSFGRTIAGYDNGDAVLSGIESRTSSPIRIVRDEKLMAVGHPGLFPAGEGAGYAGGITSAAADGIKVAEAVAARICS
jgi:Uncharacterized FAD-dependent dehydrogenases